MEPFIVLLSGLVAGGGLVMFFYPQVAFQPLDADTPPEAIGRGRWLFLGMSLTMLASGVRAAGELAGMSDAVRFTASAVLLAAGFGSMAWSIRGMKQMKHERLRRMRERHAAELAEIQARQDD